MIAEDEIPKEIVEVSKALKTWIQSYYSEVKWAIQGLGKYRLEGVSITKRFYAVFHKFLNMQNQNLLAKSQFRKFSSKKFKFV